MSAQAPSAASPCYRLDTFVVPGAARAEFLHRVRETRELFESQPGFVHGQLLECAAGDGRLRPAATFRKTGHTRRAGRVPQRQPLTKGTKHG